MAHDWQKAEVRRKTVILKNTNALIFDGKNEKNEVFDELIHTMLKMQPEMTEAMKINHFHAHLRKDALQIFRKISASNKKTLEDVLIVLRRKYVKPWKQATAKHKWHKLTFDPNTKSLSDFLEELNECAESSFGGNARHIINSLLYALLSPHLKRSLNLAFLEKGIYDQIVAHPNKTRTQWFGEWWEIDKTHNDSRTYKW